MQIDSKNLGMLGLSNADAQAFITALEALNSDFEGRFQDSIPAVDRARMGEDLEVGPGGRLAPRPRTPSSTLQNEYRSAFSNLLQQFGVSPVVEGTDKVYYLDNGSSLFNPYPSEFRFNDSPGTRPGLYTRDRRTEGDFDFGNALKGAAEGLLDPVSWLGLDGEGGGGPSPWKILTDGVRGGYDDNYGLDQGLIQQFAAGAGDSYEQQWEDFQEPGLIEKGADFAAGIMDRISGRNGNIVLPIPGLPFPIPGGMTFQDLIDMAKKAGKSVQEVLEDLMNPGQPGQPGQPGDSQNQGQGGVTNGDPSNQGGVTPGDPVGESEKTDDMLVPGGLPPGWGGSGSSGNDPVGQSEKTDDMLVPGAGPPGVVIPSPSYDPVGDDGRSNTPDPPALAPGGGNDNETPGLDGSGNSWIPFPTLIPLPDDDDDDPAPTPTAGLKYHQADTSWGHQSPDYGTVQQNPLLDIWPREPTIPGVLDEENMRRYGLI